MFRNYLKTVIRNFQKNKILFLINLGGLAVGITAVLLIGMYIYNETGYDNFQKNSASVYRIGFHFFQNGKLQGEGSEFTPPFGPDAMGEFPEISTFTRISSQRMSYISWNDKALKVENIHHADSNFFQVFSYKLLQGNPYTVLREPYSIVLTTGIAKKLFGKSEDAMGKVVRLDNQTNYLVTGIAQEPPSNSHLGYDVLLSFVTLYKEPGNFLDWNGGEQYITYLQLKDGVDRGSFEKKLPGFMWKHINEEYSKVGFRLDAFLEPVRDIHLNYGDDNGTLRTNLYIFSIVALLILVISCVNYVNLTLAQATTRFKEIGVKKVIGATRRILARQFLFETLLTTLLAFLIAIALALLVSPVYRHLLGKNLPLLSFGTLPALLILFFIILGVAVITGSYVAYHLSSFSITRIFRSSLPRSRQNLFRKGLVVAQFAISIGLMSYTLLVTLQLKFSKNINPGYDREHVLILPLVGEQTGRACPLLQQKISQIPEVDRVSGLSEVPYDGITSNGFTPEGSSKAMVLHQLDADENFLSTFNIKLLSGTYFSKDHPLDKDG